MSSMLAMPCTTVQKMIGAISILISEMKPSPSGLSLTAISGEKWPNTPPSTIAPSTHR